MTIKEAYRILGLSPETGMQEIKKKYRELMMRVHPDVSHPPVSGKYAYTAQEINTAYSLLKETISTDAETGSGHNKDIRSKDKQTAAWNAPVNQNAYAEREILQHAEDSEGIILGNFCIAKGKYMWTTDEDFSLFLLSLYQCSKRILDEADSLLHRYDAPTDRTRFQAELTYLLAQQFIAQTTLLQELAKEEKKDSEGNRIFYIPSMLEVTGDAIPLKPGEMLYPSGVRHHRLYLKNHAGQKAGYLSFPDDRLYYVVVPLFEQKVVQIRIQTAEKQPTRKKKASKGYQNLHLWIKLSGKACSQLPENLNLQIERLLEQYKSI